MRRTLVFTMLCMAAALGIPESAHAACGTPVPMIHGFDSYIECADGKRPTAYAWQMSAPTTVNSGAVGIVCTTTGENNGACVNPISGTPGDGKVTVEFDWSTPGVNGCPVVGTTSNRIMMSLQCSDGKGVILSLSGADPGFGYTVELAHQTDGSVIFPLAAGSDNCRPTVRSSSTSNGMLNAQLHFNPVRSACDCGAGSVGVLTQACNDAFDCDSGSCGNVHTFTGPCDTPPPPGLASWTNTGIAPDAAGDAVITTPLPTDATRCLFIGAPTRFGGQTSNGVSGFFPAVNPALPAADRALEVRAARAQGKVTVTFRTGSELEAVSFEIVAGGRALGAPIAARGGNGVGASYEAALKLGDFRGEKSLAVRTNLRNGGSITSDPVSF